MSSSEKPEVSTAELSDNSRDVEAPNKAEVIVDTVHTDEAMKVLAAYTGEQTWTDDEEKKIRRRIDWKVLPILFLTYTLQYYDKAMISQAALFGLREDLGLTVGNRYSWMASIFYLGFIIGAYPCMVLAQRYPVERVACGTVTLWGLCLILTTVCVNYQGVYAQRFFLGFLESGISPMFMLIVGSWYRKEEQAMRMGVWYCCTGYVSIISPLINYGFGLIGGGVSSWRYMYYFGGAITMAWGIALYWLLPTDPVNARGFNERERYIMVARLRSNNSGVRNTHFKGDQVLELITDLKFWLLFSVSLLSMIANGPISAFIPVIIRGFGFSSLNSLLLLCPAGAWAGTMMLLFSYLAFKLKNARTYLIFIAQLGTVLACLLLWKLPMGAKVGLLFGTTLLPTLGAGYAVLMGLQVANTAGYTKRSIASSGVFIGYCIGNFVGPLCFEEKDAPRYAPGFIIVLITALVAAGLILVYRFLCVWENHRRDKAGTLEGFDHAYEDDLTDRTNKQPPEGSRSRCRDFHPLPSKFECGKQTFAFDDSSITRDIMTEFPKRKRADLVCSACHAKKIKCDLQNRSEGEKCSGCYATGSDCQIRPSKRKKSSHSSTVQDPSQDTITVTSHDPEQEPRQPLPLVRPSTATATVITATAAATASAPSGARTDPGIPPPSSRINETSPSHHTAELITGVATGRSNPSDVDTGFLHVFGPETNADAEQQELEATLDYGYGHADSRQQELQQIYADTYVEFCYPWCPVLDVDRILEDTARSPLLANALAVAGSHIRPPLLPHDGPAAYYKRAISLFYNDEESDGITTLQAVALFYWWAPRSISIAHRHSSWWWTSVLIRHAQQMNLHREPSPSQPLHQTLNLSLRRRIWWTAFARERLTALCQSKPCIIDPSDCNIAPPSLSDFPSSPTLQRKAEIFIHWVALCAIIGRVAKALSRPGAPFPAHLRQELVDWVSSLPPHLQLPITRPRTASFDRDVHQLHLPYLTTIIVLHLRRSAHDLPQALPPAILAASCIVRILRDILSRGNARFLMAITCWYSGTAFTALLQATRISKLAKDANDGLDVLTNAVEELQKMWGSARVIRQGFDRLRIGHSGPEGRAGLDGLGMAARTGGGQNGVPLAAAGRSARPHANGNGVSLLDSGASEERDFDWPLLFPFVTPETNGIARVLLQGDEPGMATRFPSPEGLLFQDAFMVDYHGLLGPFETTDLFGFGDLPLGGM
ncbi:major facilitator superfamily domain-containing protein [Podospora aff. communis PSN243]|uniref:Major facilitator superfamily domain-containing protein n=1 Tax=Podospora aff. communis PSN243 TaxID=3040156 RepID=A0AAV9GG16_9PEZI|nr:major facilitator superfamily domain-containing protein [Podospora aff. communis PSN243]